MPKSAEIQDQLNAIDTQIQQGASGSHLDLLEMNKSDLKRQLETTLAEEASQQERVQAQTEKVESITLPLDFNDLLENSLANEMIIEVVKQFQLQAYEEHNAEVERIRAENKSNLDALYARHNEVTEQFKQDKDELKKRIDAENEQAKVDAKEIADLTQQVAQLGLDKQDAEAKRDNAVSELEQAKVEIDRLNSHVFELQQQIASAPAPRQAIDITPNERLADLAKQAKETVEQKAARGLARWNQSNPELAVAPLEFPVLPTLEPVASQNVEQSAPSEQVIHPSEVQATDHTNVQADQGNEPIHEVVQPAVTYATKEEHEALAARVARIEAHANLPAVA